MPSFLKPARFARIDFCYQKFLGHQITGFQNARIKDRIMPLPKLCNHPCCKTIVYDGCGRCLVHRAPSKRPHSKYRDKKQAARHAIYASRKWRKLSLMKRTTDPLCAECDRQGVMTAAVMVDHIIEIEDNPTLSYEWDNLQSLCNSCHNEKTAIISNYRNSHKTREIYKKYLSYIRGETIRPF